MCNNCFGGNSWIWVILIILIFFGGCGCNMGCGCNTGCGCDTGCNTGCGCC